MASLLVANWRAVCLRAWSVRVGLLAVGFGSLDARSQAAILDWFGVPATRLPAVVGMALIVARVMRQNSVTDADPRPTRKR